MGWRYYEIGPTGKRYTSRPFYAPSLERAFHHARLLWGGSHSLTFYGSKLNHHDRRREKTCF